MLFDIVGTNTFLGHILLTTKENIIDKDMCVGNGLVKSCLFMCIKLCQFESRLNEFRLITAYFGLILGEGATISQIVGFTLVCYVLFHIVLVNW